MDELDALTNFPASPPEELEQTQADRIAKSLKYAGLTHADMAEYLEVHRNTIGGYTTGKSRMLPVIMRLWAQKTGVPYEWLRDGVWPEDKSPKKAAKAQASKPAPAKKTPAKKAVKKVSARQGRR